MSEREAGEALGKSLAALIASESSVAEKATPTAERSSSLGQVFASFREHRALASIVLAYAAICYLLRLIFGYVVLAPIDLTTLEIWFTYSALALGFAGSYHLIRFHVRYFRNRAAAGRHGFDPLVKQWERYRVEHFSAFRLTGVVVACGILSVLMTTFLAYKKAIPLFHPFSWDLAFMEADRAVHLGTHPWELLQPLFGSLTATVIIDWIYLLWIRSIPLVIAWQVWNRDRELRAQFLLSYVITAILLGTVMAIWLSSAGPCYYAEVVGGPDPYAPLFAFLGDVNSAHPLAALRLQELLWQGYMGTGEFFGISAMPSMHVALPVLYVLAGFRTKRWLGWAFVVYLLAILIGSVHLGWHYAIDGYVSIVSVLAIWAIVGQAIRRMRPSLKRHSEEA